jgi:hypothetical protein
MTSQVTAAEDLDGKSLASLLGDNYLGRSCCLKEECHQETGNSLTQDSCSLRFFV